MVEKITSVILSEAKERAEKIVSDATEAKENKLNALKNRLAEEQSAREIATEKECESVTQRRLTVAGLDARMQTLSAKRAVMDEAYALAVEKILSSKQYETFYSSLVAKHAGDGDVFVISKGDNKRFDEEWLSGIIKTSGKKLSLAKEYIEANGGVILRADSCEIDLTLDALMSEIKEKYENKVLEVLFGE